jgi:CTP synthase
VRAIEYARTNGIPFFGICLGMQMAVVEFARNVCGLDDAYSAEFKADCANPVIHLMEEQKGVNRKGGTMRLGAYPCTLTKGSFSQKAYGGQDISERHRHRYEFNNAYRDRLSAAGLLLAGINGESDLVEIVEIPDHPWFLGCQFHPEFKSRPLNPHPLFKAFIAAALGHRKR